MPTINIKLISSDTLSKEEGRHPIYIVVCKDRTIKRKMVGAAFKEEWDSDKKSIRAKGRKDHVLANIKIEDEFAKYNEVFKQLDRSGKAWRADDVFKEPDVIESNEVTFYKSSQDYINTLEVDGGTYAAAKARFEKIKRFAPIDFKLEGINEAWILNFIKHCKTKEKNKGGGLGNNKNTINQSVKFIKRIASFTGSENAALKKIKLTRVKPLKTKLTIEEINKIADLEIEPGTIRYHARNIFLVQFYFRGMRIGDALRLETTDIVDNRLKYDANKTNVDYDMKIVKPCMDILTEYLEERQGYVFPLLRKDEKKSTVKEFVNELKNRTSVVNWHLNEIAISCGITKKVSSHIARHSFGSIADKQLEGNLKTLQGLFGHSSRAMTEEYIRELRKTDDLDDAADQVLG